MGKRKFKKGTQVVNVAEFLEHEWFIVNGKTYHKGWCMSWPLKLSQIYVDRGVAYIAKRLTNGEYYSGKTDEELREIAGENLCKSCLMTSSMRSTPLYAVKTIECLRGARVHCRDALAAWKEEPVE